MLYPASRTPSPSFSAETARPWPMRTRQASRSLVVSNPKRFRSHRQRRRSELSSTGWCASAATSRLLQDSQGTEYHSAQAPGSAKRVPLREDRQETIVPAPFPSAPFRGGFAVERRCGKAVSDTSTEAASRRAQLTPRARLLE